MSLTHKEHYARYGAKGREHKRLKYATDPATRARQRVASKAWATGNPDKVRTQKIDYRRRLKAEMVAAYGGGCACCGEEEIDFLTIDHVLDDGKEHRAQFGKNTSIRVWADARRQGWPKDRYRVLCFNCNIARSLFGVCPHQRPK